MAGPRRIEQDGVRGWLHAAPRPAAALALTHGAGSDCHSALLVALAAAFTERNWSVLRYDLPFRRGGAPFGAQAQARDRDGIRAAAQFLGSLAPAVPLCLAGHSYGGRQSSILAAQDPSGAAALLLLSYPLHPPRQPAKARVEHLPQLRVPTLFVHGDRDGFGTIAELEAARALIPARTALQPIPGAPHGLPPDCAPRIADWFVTFTSK